jgi:hypothetical protein
LSTGTLREATKYIVENARGVFVWVNLVRLELLRVAGAGIPRSSDEILGLLKTFPRDLEKFYELMLKRLEERRDGDLRDSVKCLQFVLFARRPLALVELHGAVAIPDGGEFWDGERHGFTLEQIEKRIMHFGGNFLETKSLGGTFPNSL